MEKENIKTVTIEDFKNSQHILDYIDCLLYTSDAADD